MGGVVREVKSRTQERRQEDRPDQRVWFLSHLLFPDDAALVAESTEQRHCPIIVWMEMQEE